MSPPRRSAGEAGVACYPSQGKRKAMKLCAAFAEGCGGRVMPEGYARLEHGAAFFYGWTGHTIPLIRRCIAENRAWYYADNAYYFGRGRYFRVTRGALMHDGCGEAPANRPAPFSVEVKPWRDTGHHVVVATQSELFYRLRLGVSRREWTEQVVDELKRHTNREILVCDKPPPGPAQEQHVNFEHAIEGAWAVVSHSSSVMVKALAEGVPVISLGRSMASVMGSADLARIEDPVMPQDRARWLAVLLANQWTRSEMHEGICWRTVNAPQHPSLTRHVATGFAAVARMP